MARLVVSEGAKHDLDELIRTRSLPTDTRERVKRSLRPLRNFPELGAELNRSLDKRRFILGPWRWMVVLYRFYPERDLVAILAIVDGRTSASPTANR